MIQRSFVSIVLAVALIPSLASADEISDAVPRSIRPFVFAGLFASTYVPMKISQLLIEDGFCKNSRVQFCCVGHVCKEMPSNSTKCEYPKAGHLYCSNDTHIQPSIIPLISSNVEADVHLNYAGPFLVSGAILFWLGASYTLHSLIVDVIPFVIFKGLIGSPYAISLFALHVASGFVKP
jgi:hypothetical protein